MNNGKRARITGLGALVSIAFVISGLSFGVIDDNLTLPNLATRPADKDMIVYYQPRKPTPEESTKGRLALLKWKNSFKFQRNRLSFWIVAGKALTGMSASDVRNWLGNPDARGEGDRTFLYNVALDFYYRDYLIIKFEDGKAVSATVNKESGMPGQNKVNDFQ